MKIGRFQLENLLREGIRFLFIDLRTPDERASLTEPLFEKALPMSLTELRENLVANKVSPDAAILLLDDSGATAPAAAADLEATGYKNVYYVTARH